MKLTKEICSMIKNRRLELDMTAEELAMTVGVDRMTIHGIESRRTNPRVYNLMKILRALNLPDIGTLITTSDNKGVECNVL